MIFGFNTDVKHDETVYHVQSEARQHERLLQTQVFVRGRCIGKLATSYADKLSEPDFSEKQMEHMLRTQHKTVLDSIRDGKLDSVLPKPPAPAPALKLQWVSAKAVEFNHGMLMRLLVTDGASGIEGVRVTSRVNLGDAAPLYSQATTDSSGTAELKIAAAASALADSSVLVQASHAGRVATRKFRLRKASK